jgi:hypothetical protein
VVAVLVWQEYCSELQAIIEQNYTSGVKQFDVTIGGEMYEIDLTVWKQINKQNRTKTRGIKVDGPRIQTAVQRSLFDFKTDFPLPLPLPMWMLRQTALLVTDQATNSTPTASIYANANMSPQGRPNLNAGVSFSF